jgi:hypothetical protein
MAGKIEAKNAFAEITKTIADTGGAKYTHREMTVDESYPEGKEG